MVLSQMTFEGNTWRLSSFIAEIFLVLCLIIFIKGTRMVWLLTEFFITYIILIFFKLLFQHGYLFYSSFQEAYLERGVDCYVDFLDEVPSAYQIKKDSRAL
jgi:hypothetical protein